MYDNVKMKFSRAQILIKKTFIELIGEKGFYNISVKEIIERADVSRTTFYLYYEDKFHLLSTIQNELLQGLEQIFRTVRESGNGKELTLPNNPYAPEYYALYFEYFEKSKNLYMLLLGPKGDGMFITRLNEFIEEQQKLTRSAWGIDRRAAYDELDYMGCISSWAYTGVFVKWMNDPKNRPTPLRMGEILACFFTKISTDNIFC